MKIVDWKAAEDMIDQDHIREKGLLRARVELFINILTEAGNTSVGKTEPSDKKFAMNPKVKALVNKRKSLERKSAREERSG